MNPPAAPPAPSSRRDVTEGLRRWRGVFPFVVLLTLAIAATGFLTNRASVLRALRSGSVSRLAADAQRALWLEESALRRYGLRAESSAVPLAREARSDAAAQLRDLRAQAEDGQRARIDSIGQAVEGWQRAFADPILELGTLDAEIAMAATDRFDEVSRHFDLFQDDALARRERLSRIQTLVDWTTFALLLLTLAIAAVVFRRVAAALEREAERARAQAARLESQSAELQQQAQALEDQTTQLEETTAELEHRVEESDDANRRLEETSAFLDSAVESAPFGIAFFDRDVRFLRLNQAMGAISGMAAEAHFGLTPTDTLPVLGARLEPVLARVLRTGVAESDVLLDGEAPSAPGARRRWSATCYPLRSRGRPPIGVGVMLVDVSARSQLEDQLRQAQKMEAVGRLAGGIAHDFNNVLTVIQSYGELLAAGIDEGSPAREEIDAIRAAADRAATLARKLLAFSRREVVIPRVVDVNEVVVGMEGILRRLLRQGIDLQLELAPEALLVRCDSGQLEQVIMNLAINAVDAMPAGGQLRIVTSGAEVVLGADKTRPETAAVISVRDTGTGMSSEIQGLLFEPFFTTKPAGRGTGLGLATGYAIVRGAGGTIRVQSVEGQGSAFDIVLPRLGESEREPQSRLSPSRGLAMPGGGETILLVEDEPAIRSALSRMLRTAGYRILEAAHGGEALRVAGEESGTIDLLLTDVMMPGIGGKELVQRFLAIRPHTRVILMSGYTDDEALRRDLGEARYVFLQKPFTAKKVAAAVRELLDAD